jgi:signal transduction histidine kinase
MGEKLISQAAEGIRAGLLAAVDNFKSVLMQCVDMSNSEELSMVTISKKFCVDFLKALDQTTGKANSILETASLVKDSCNVALETLNDMLTFDKIDENMLVVEISDVDPLQLVNDSVKPFQINAREAEVQLNIHNQMHAPDESNMIYVVKADRFKLNQVLRNFLSNAMKFTSVNGKVDVVLEIISFADSKCEAPGDAKNVVRLSVTDTGVGISMANQSKLFGQYVQFDAAALQHGKGSGLGLWISKSKS